MPTDIPRESDELRKEIVETRAQAIKLANQVGLLVAEVREMRRATERHARRMGWNSAGAYLVFVALMGGGGWVAWRATLDRFQAERDSLQHDRDALARDFARRKDEDAARRQAEATALEIHRLLRAGKRREALEVHAKLAGDHLPELAADTVREGIARARGEIAWAAFQAGQEHHLAGQWSRAAAELRRSLELFAEPPWAGEARYLLGVALHRSGKHAEAAAELEAALRAGGPGVGADAGFHLATAYDELRRHAAALGEYRRFLAQHPLHRLAAAARRRIALLSK